MKPVAQSTILRAARRDIAAISELLDPAVSKIGAFGKWHYGNCKNAKGETYGVRWMVTPEHPYAGVAVLYGHHYSEHDRDGFGHPKTVKS